MAALVLPREAIGALADGPGFAIGLKGRAGRPDVPQGVKLLLSEGYDTPGKGWGRYVETDLPAEFARKNPRATVVSSSGRVFRLIDPTPNPYQFGAVGDGVADDTDAWDALCRYAQDSNLAAISLEGAVLGGNRTFTLPIGIDLLARGGSFKAQKPFTGEAVVSTPPGQQYAGIDLDTLAVDANDVTGKDGEPVAGVILRWAAYTRIGRLEVTNASGHGLWVQSGDPRSPKGSTHELFCNYVLVRAGSAVHDGSIGVLIEGSDHAFTYGVVVGFPIGGASRCANSFLGTWHVWSSYHDGKPQTWLGWDASGEGNRATIEVDSPGMRDRNAKPGLTNGPIGVFLHENAIRNQLDIMLNVSKWGSPRVRPPAGSIMPLVIATGKNDVSLDIVDYWKRSGHESLISKDVVRFTRPDLSGKNHVRVL